MSKTLVLWIKVADDLEGAELALVKKTIAEAVENNDSGAVRRADWQEDED